MPGQPPQCGFGPLTAAIRSTDASTRGIV
ncbi:MAG: hypothetical protein JWQ31_3202, partial [Mycobacterium sp.]|nr:hypothetical protein [Mycobacterium sp.]